MKCYKIKMAQIDNSHGYFEKKRKKKGFFRVFEFRVRASVHVLKYFHCKARLLNLKKNTYACFVG